MRFHQEARSNQCFVISSCGFDSIPADLGTMYVQEKFHLPCSVEAFHTFQTTAKTFSESHADTCWILAGLSVIAICISLLLL